MVTDLIIKFIFKLFLENNVTNSPVLQINIHLNNIKTMYNKNNQQFVR